MVPLSKSGLRLYRSVGSNPTLSAKTDYGEVLEWSNRRAWRARVAFGYRGFESHPLRQPTPRLRLASQINYVVRIYSEKRDR
jgi:hypothetical protein